MSIRMAVMKSAALCLAAAFMFLPPRAEALEIARLVTESGIEVWHVEERSVPLIVMEAAWETGAAYDPEGKEGLALMLAALMGEGAGDLDAQAFQGRLDDLAVKLRFDARQDTLEASLKTLSENRDEAFTLLKLALEEPRFDEAAVERIRAQLRISVASDLDRPGEIASRAWYDAALPQHPYSRPRKGTPDTLAAIAREDLIGAHAALLPRGKLRISVVGDIGADELERLIDDTFGNMPEGAGRADVPDVEVTRAPVLDVIERDIPQSVVIFGHGGLKRDDPDFIPAFVMNHVLGGGGFTARLMTEVRQKRGLAYSVGTYLYPLRRTGLFIGQVATENARVAESIEIIRAEIARMAEEGVSAEELEDAKTYLTGSYPLRFDSNEKIAGQLIGLQLAGLPASYVDDRNALIEAVTQEDILRVAGRLLDPDNLIVTVVGKPEGLQTRESFE